jgi:hypothetical protein
MSIKSKVFAAAAALTLVGGAGAVAATATAANAATPSCGHSCIDAFTRAFSTHSNPSFVLDVLRQGEKVGQPIILFRQSNSDPAEDFTIAYSGQVSDFLAAGMIGPAVALHYGAGCELMVPIGSPPVQTCELFYPNDFAFEVEYAPYGVNSGLCVGVPTTAANDTEVSLQPCGVTSKTVWIQDIANATGFSQSYAPYINGSDTNFSHPFVLDYPHNSYPTDMPRPQLNTNELELNAHHDIVQDTQEWSADFGILR